MSVSVPDYYRILYLLSTLSNFEIITYWTAGEISDELLDELVWNPEEEERVWSLRASTLGRD
jgi:hypothetical protein